MQTFDGGGVREGDEETEWEWAVYGSEGNDK